MQSTLLINTSQTVNCTKNGINFFSLVQFRSIYYSYGLVVLVSKYSSQYFTIIGIQETKMRYVIISHLQSPKSLDSHEFCKSIAVVLRCSTTHIGTKSMRTHRCQLTECVENGKLLFLKHI